MTVLNSSSISQRPVFVMSEPIPLSEAKLQHDELVETLKKHGAEVLQVPLVPNAFDSVFMKDTAVLLQVDNEWRAFMASPRHPERQREQSHRKKELQHLGFKIAAEAEVDFEGGDLALLADDRTALLGYGFRTDKAVTPQLSEFLNRKLVPIELTHPDLFHLDLVVATLHNGSVFACKDAMTDESWQSLKKLECIDKLVPVSLKDALNFCLNWVEVHSTVIMANDSKDLTQQLNSMGRIVDLAPLDHFHQRRGSAACLVAKIITT